MNTAPATDQHRHASGARQDDPALLLLLGICPLLGAIVSLLAGLGLGIATLAILVGASALASAMRHRMPGSVRFAAALLLIATLATAVSILFEVFLFDLFLALGIALPLLVTNAGIVVQVGTVDSDQPLRLAVVDAAALGGRMILLMAALGAGRELLGQGSLLSGADAFGENAAAITVHLTHGDAGFTLTLVPAGGFLLLGLLVGMHNAIKARQAAPT